MVQCLNAATIINYPNNKYISCLNTARICIKCIYKLLSTAMYMCECVCHCRVRVVDTTCGFNNNKYHIRCF